LDWDTPMWPWGGSQDKQRPGEAPPPPVLLCGSVTAENRDEIPALIAAASGFLIQMDFREALVQLNPF